MIGLNPKARTLMLAKSISVWWGIYLIIGCCIGFSIKTLNGLLFTFENMSQFRLSVFVPVVACGSLVLAVISYFISFAINRLPVKKLRKQLDKIAAEKGISKEYTDLLALNCRGDMKNKVCIELAIAALLNGDAAKASEQLARIDIVSVSDVANSTGNYYIAAYYHAVNAVIHLAVKDSARAASDYDNGRFYIDSMNNDPFITAVKALCLMKKGERKESFSLVCEADNLRKRKLSKGRYNHLQSFVLAAKANIFYDVERYEECFDITTDAMSIKISPEYEQHLISLGRAAKDNMNSNPSDFS